MKKFILIFTILVGVGFGFSKTYAMGEVYKIPVTTTTYLQSYVTDYTVYASTSVTKLYSIYLYGGDGSPFIASFTGQMINGILPFSEIKKTTSTLLNWLGDTIGNYSLQFQNEPDTDVWNSNFFRIATGTNLTGATINFITPTSSAITNGFSFWKFKFTQPTSTAVQLSPVVWWGTNSSCQTTSTGCNVDTSNVYLPGFEYQLSGNSIDFEILKSAALIPGQTYYVSAHELISSASSSITFYTPYGPLLPQTTTSVTQIATSGPGFLFWQVTSSTSQCIPAEDWTDVGGGIKYGFCSAIEWLLIPDNSNVNFMQNALLRYKTLFPFNLIFMTYDNLYAGISEGNKMQKTLTFSLPQVGLTADVLSATTLSGQMSTSTYSTYMETATNFIWLASAIAIFIILLV